MKVSLPTSVLINVNRFQFPFKSALKTHFQFCVGYNHFTTCDLSTDKLSYASIFV